MSGHAIQSIVAGIVIFVVSLVLFEPMTTGADKLYREFVPHCAKGDDSTLKVSATAATVHATKDQVFSVSKKGTTTTCEITGLTAGAVAATAFHSEDGTGLSLTPASETATTVDLGSDWAWTIPADTLTQFGSINKLVLSLLPLVIVVGFMATSFINLYTNRSSGGMGIANAIKSEVGTLVIALIAIFVSPIGLDYIASSSQVVSGGSVTITNQFASIMSLLFGFMPVGMTLGIIGLIGWRGYSAYKGLGGGKAAGGMM